MEDADKALCISNCQVYDLLVEPSQSKNLRKKVLLKDVLKALSLAVNLRHPT